MYDLRLYGNKCIVLLEESALNIQFDELIQSFYSTATNQLEKRDIMFIRRCHPFLKNCIDLIVIYFVIVKERLNILIMYLYTVSQINYCLLLLRMLTNDKEKGTEGTFVLKKALIICTYIVTGIPLLFPLEYNNTKMISLLK